MSRGQVDRRAADDGALRERPLVRGVLHRSRLVNGILAILLIALLQALGVWGVGASETASVALESTDELRSTLRPLWAPR